MTQIVMINVRELDRKSFSAVCAYCEKHVELRPKQVAHSEHRGEHHYFLCECALCHRFSMVYTQVHQRIDSLNAHFRVVMIYPQAQKPSVPEELPENIKDDWKALVELVGDPVQKGTVVMLCRKIIDLITKEFDSEHKFLSKRIAELEEKNLVAPQLKEWADTIRILGNVGVHEPAKNITPEEANELWNFTRLFVEYVYVLPKRIKSLQEEQEAQD